MLAVEAPSVEDTRGGLLPVANVITPGASQQIFTLKGVKYEPSLRGVPRDVPEEGGPVEAPAITLGAVTAAGGTFAAGTYYWRLTALTERGETDGSNEVSATLALNDSQTINWTAIEGATGYRLYRGNAPGGQNVLVAEVGEVTTYTDTGSAGTASAVPAQSTAGNIPAPDKVFDQVGVITGQPFTIYQGVEFSMFERTQTLAEANQAFGSGETVAVERAIQRLILEPNAVDLTPVAGTPVTKLKWAVGKLEQWIGERYGALPIIHANRLGTSLMEELPAPEQNWRLHTHQGTPIANGSGYADTGAPAGATWLYVTGQVNLWKGQEHTYEAPALKENRHYGLVEATYVPTVEGFVAKILVGI